MSRPALVVCGDAADLALREALRHCEAAADVVGVDRLVTGVLQRFGCKRAGPRRKPPQASVNERRLRAYEAGDTVGQIARREKITKEAVRQSLRRARRARTYA